MKAWGEEGSGFLKYNWNDALSWLKCAAQIAKKSSYSDAVLFLNRILLVRHLRVRQGVAAVLQPGHKDLVDTWEVIKTNQAPPEPLTDAKLSAKPDRPLIIGANGVVTKLLDVPPITDRITDYNSDADTILGKPTHPEG